MTDIKDAPVVGRAVIEAPPLDYALDDELAIPHLHHDAADFDDDDSGGVPNPAPGAWLMFFVMATVVIAVALLTGWLP
jgi:hypothetical protein